MLTKMPAALLLPFALAACSSSHAHTHAPCPGTEEGADHQHPHAHAAVVKHSEIKSFGNNGNSLRGIATKSQGAQSYEVWRSSVAPGNHTPKHKHESEEVFIFLKGKGRAVIGGDEFLFEAPATVIAPAGVEHQFFNTGDEATDAIVVVGIDSKIYDEKGALMDLPWRK